MPELACADAFWGVKKRKLERKTPVKYHRLRLSYTCTKDSMKVQSLTNFKTTYKAVLDHITVFSKSQFC